MTSVRIAIATSGRFHVCDLARELSHLGNAVSFYSLVSPSRTEKFGLPKECNRWMLPRVWPWAIWARFAQSSGARERATARLNLELDRVISKCLEHCDAFIGMSGLSNRSAVTARTRYNARVWIERGSTHILCQKRILDSLPGVTRVSDETVRRELLDYKNSDYVSVLSQHCLESFIEHGVDGSRLFRNPLGVDLSIFRPTESPIGDEPTIIMTGNWSYQKGCHWLVEAWKRLPGVRLLHVGKVGDCPLPKDPGFEHHEPVDQNHLIDFYRRAHVFVLASAQDGLATVQPQALACGLRLVCTTRTGGADLRQFVLDSDVISVVDPGDVGSLANAIREQLRMSLLESGVRIRLCGSAKEDLSWGGYARRYDTEIRSKLGLIGSVQSCER